MKNIFATLMISILAAAPLGAEHTPEYIRRSGEGPIRELLELTPTRYENVWLEGELSLGGQTSILGDRQSVYIRLSGYAQIQGDDGITQSGRIRISVSKHFFIRGNRASETIRIFESVSLYRDGRYVGSATVSGNIHVSGWKSGNWLRVSGRGRLTGSTLLPAPKE